MFTEVYWGNGCEDPPHFEGSQSSQEEEVADVNNPQHQHQVHQPEDSQVKPLIVISINCKI